MIMPIRRSFENYMTNCEHFSISIEIELHAIKDSLTYDVCAVDCVPDILRISKEDSCDASGYSPDRQVIVNEHK